LREARQHARVLNLFFGRREPFVNENVLEFCAERKRGLSCLPGESIGALPHLIFFINNFKYFGTCNSVRWFGRGF
jgi:hypothetical protein